MEPYYSIMLLLAAFGLVFLNAFFVLSEFAIVKVRNSRLEELLKNGVKNAKLAIQITNKLDTYLSATQLGITFASLALGWISEMSIARLIKMPFVYFFGAESVMVHVVATAISFILVTLLHVVLGELVPKSVAIAKTESVVLAISRPLHAFWVVFFPFIKTFDVVAGFFLKRMGIEPAHSNDMAHSDEELKIIVGESLKGGYIDSVEGEIIKNAVDFSDTIAKEIMTPRKDIIVLSAKNTYEENLSIVLSTNHTRYPYAQENKDNIVGMIHIRDLLQNIDNKKKDMGKLVRNMIVVPESAHISAILKDMNKKQVHTALVLDEYGGTAGLLTMEDIIEEIMGDISDEHDHKSEEIKDLGDGKYLIDGMLDIESVAEKLNVEFDEDSDHVTIAGYVFGELGRLPVVDDKVIIGNYEFKVKEMDGSRIKLLHVTQIATNIDESEHSS